MLELYKAYIGDLGNIGGRYATANGFYLSVVTALIAVLALGETDKPLANLEIGLVKQFEEPVKTTLRRLPSIKGTGLTPLGEAMQVAARRLAPRRETRKIMLVLTDGRAGCEANDGSAVKHAQYVAERIQGAGIELIGVGIMDESLRAIVADTIVVHQLEELPAQLCKLLSRTLKKGLRYVG